MQPWIARLHRTALASRSMPAAVRYAITITIVFAIVWARITWGGGELERYPFLVFMPIILGSGALLDRGNGFLATGLSTGLVDYYNLPPLYSMAVASGQDQAALGLFFLSAFSSHSSSRRCTSGSSIGD